MVSSHPVKAFLILVLAALACSDIQSASTPPLPDPIVTVPPTLTPIALVPPLTADIIRNASYQIAVREDHPIVQFSNGQFVQGSDSAAPDYASVLVTSFIAFGDLDNDGISEAAAIIVENFGGTGQFAVLAVYRNQGGAPVLLTSLFIDDRPMINTLSIDGGEIFLDATVHSFEDAGCCPTLGTTRRYALINNSLRLTHFTSTTPTGVVREIEITSPPHGSQVSGNVRIIGTVTVSPFENNLVIRFLDLAGTELFAGPMPVVASTLGGPGTFDTVVNISIFPVGTVVFVELEDTSAADGSVLAMDSVQLVVK